MSDLFMPAAAQVALSQAGAAAGVQPATTADPTRAGQAAEQFEAVFLAQMLQPMFAGIDTNGPFGGGHGEQVFRSLMIQEYGRLMTRAGGIGVSEQVMAEMLKMQEIADGGAQP